MAAKRAKTAQAKRRRRAGIATFQRLLALEYLIEVLFANEFANLPEEHAERLMVQILRMDGDLGKVLTIDSLKPSQRLIALLLSRAMERAKSTRARVEAVSSSTKQ